MDTNNLDVASDELMDLEELGKLAREAVDQFQMLSESEGAAVSDQPSDVLDGFSPKVEDAPSQKREVRRG
ncbi:MAG UNVERIFIED_CONTAM: hypothetical protein LVR29_20550 [Microcystis novacekii LVE1205-3]|jgi:hypothetical protein